LRKIQQDERTVIALAVAALLTIVRREPLVK
jgi:hypothetical protein